MKRTFAAVALAVLFAAPTAPADSPPLIVIDRWWGVDYAKGDCWHDQRREAICNQERTEAYNRFELELKTQFAALKECSGINVASFGYPQNLHQPSPDLSQPYWSFAIDYYGNDPAQLWKMLPPKGSHLQMMEATGTPAQIATQVCTIIKGKGGAVVE